MAVQYYQNISSLFVERKFVGDHEEAISAALYGPLRYHDPAFTAHGAFASYFLTLPTLSSFGNLDDLTRNVDVDLLSEAIVKSAPLSELAPHSQLWLLTHLIRLHRHNKSQSATYIRALSMLLSSCANEILDHMNPQDLEEGAGDGKKGPQLPELVRGELSSLINESSISGLLTKFNTGYNEQGNNDASLIANYALMLLRIFPSRGDDIRMWLFKGHMSVPDSRMHLPAAKFFWRAMASTSIFSTIRRDAKSVVGILKPDNYLPAQSLNDATRNREWCTILLFLELYNFVLRFTDDEEFLSGGEPSMGQALSGFGESALPLTDVTQLTVFLKNLAFTMYYNAADLFDDAGAEVHSSLSSYFGNSSNAESEQSARKTISDRMDRVSGFNRPFVGITGVTYAYVRTIVTGVLKMLYERDSRRKFLPKDHWLMTYRFDMEAFIPAVVQEEERRRGIEEEDDEDDDADDDADGDRGALTGQSRRTRQVMNMQNQQQKMVYRKTLAVIGPRLEILENMPFVIPFETRVQIFRQFVLHDQQRRRGHLDPNLWRLSVTQQAIQMQQDSGEILSRHHATIRRDRVFEDAFDQFYKLDEGLKEPIQITFQDTYGSVEAGIDGGGVTKEFLTSVTNEAFRSSGGPNLFVTNDQNLLYPSPTALDEKTTLLQESGIAENSPQWKMNISHLLQQFEFLGRIIGKCLYEGILVDISFAGFFLLKWASYGNTGAPYRANINDLRDLDEGLYQGLLKLKNYPGDVSDFALDFTITDTWSYPGQPTHVITRPLSHDANTPVTNENRPHYLAAVAHHRLLKQPYYQTHAFLKGLSDIIKPSWLSMFNQSELQTLIAGESTSIDVEDLRAHTVYGGLYVIGDDGLEHPTIQLFWQVMHEMNDDDRRKVLKYVTSSPRAPLLGFDQLNPHFSIRDGGNDASRLPSTSTCVNLLKLPVYKDIKTLRDKLMYAVNSGTGFHLS